jgi:hypothetical protein
MREIAPELTGSGLVSVLPVPCRAADPDRQPGLRSVDGVGRQIIGSAAIALAALP